MGHELVGVVEETGTAVTSVKKGDFVIATFAFQDNTCVFCREGFQTACVHGGWLRHPRERRPAGRVRPHPAGRRQPHPRTGHDREQ